MSVDKKTFNELVKEVNSVIPTDESPCPAGCLFDTSGRLRGDCRAPSSKDCLLNKRNRGTNLDVSTD